jgi:DNA-binding LacI/PurR family transcriptional regulator
MVYSDSGARASGPPSIYDVARVAGVAASTVSRALSKPGRVSLRTAEHVRQVAAELGYRSSTTQRDISHGSTSTIAMVLADITNPVFYPMIRAAGRTAVHAGYTMVLVETQESEATERTVLNRILPTVDGIILTSSRMSDRSIRKLAKNTPIVVLNRLVDQVPSVASDYLAASKLVVEHLVGAGHRTVTYLAGPEASWADGMRWRGLLEASHEFDIRVRRIGPNLPTVNGGGQAAEKWLQTPTTGVVAFNDLVALGFMRAAIQADVRIPEQVSVVGFDNIPEAVLIRPRLTTIASPLSSLASAAVSHLLKTSITSTRRDVSVVVPARLVIRESTGPVHRRRS